MSDIIQLTIVPTVQHRHTLAAGVRSLTVQSFPRLEEAAGVNRHEFDADDMGHFRTRFHIVCFDCRGSCGHAPAIEKSRSSAMSAKRLIPQPVTSLVPGGREAGQGLALLIRELPSLLRPTIGGPFLVPRAQERALAAPGP